MTRRLHVHIERLILDGVAADRLDSESLSNAVRSTLETLLAEDGLDGRFLVGGAWHDIRGGDLGGSEHPAELGRQVGRAVHDGLRGHEGTRP